MMRRFSIAGLTLLSLALLFFLGCGGGGYGGGYGGTSTAGGGGSTGITTNLTISPTKASVTVSGMQPFMEVTKDANGNTLSGVQVVWASSNPAVATINSSG